MDDPASYEFVGVEQIDTVTKNESRRSSISMSKRLSELYSGFLPTDEDLLQMYLRSPKDPYYQEQAKSKAEDIDKRKAEIADMQNEIDSLSALLTNSDSSGIVRINAIVKIRGNNKMGAKILSRYHVSFDENMKFVNAEYLKE
jgi:hypothetical protein